MKYLLNASDVAEILEISKSASYVKIRELNRELSQNGYIIVPGKIPCAYLKAKLYGFENEKMAN